jgi:hypothetical protein
MFHGIVNGERMKKAMPERTFYNHLVGKHGVDAAKAEQMVAKFKAGNFSGSGPTTALHHLIHATNYASLAKGAHEDGEQETAEKHMGMVDHHLDKAMDLLHKENPGKKLSPNHPLAKHIQNIAHLTKDI